MHINSNEYFLKSVENITFIYKYYNLQPIKLITMTKAITFFLFFFLSAAQVTGQLNYYATSGSVQNYSNGELISMDTITYTYDDDERIVEIVSLENRNEYLYVGNTRTVDQYSLPDNELYSRTISDYNDDGFILVRTRYSVDNNVLELTDIDSTFRNSSNQEIRIVRYSDSGYGFEKGIEWIYEYTASGNLDNYNTLFFYDNVLSFRVKNFYEYNSEDKVDLRVVSTEDIINAANYSDTTTYTYNTEGLQSTTEKDYGFLGFNDCELVEYSTVGDTETILTSRTENIDCTDYIPRRRDETTYNDDIYLGREARTTYNYDENEELELSLQLNYMQEGILGDINISLNSILIAFSGGEENYRSDRTFYYKKSGSLSNSNVGIGPEVLIYPNNTEINSIVSYKVEGVDFNNIKIIDFTGQTISHRAVVNKANLYFNAPSMTGMYFVQLYNGKTPVTKVAKLIVN